MASNTNNLDLSMDLTQNFQDLQKICIMSLIKEQTNEYVREICAKFGELVDFNRPKDNLAFAVYKEERDAANAIKHLSKLFCVKYGYLKNRRSYESGKENGSSNEQDIHRMQLENQLASVSEQGKRQSDQEGEQQGEQRVPFQSLNPFLPSLSRNQQLRNEQQNEQSTALSTAQAGTQKILLRNAEIDSIPIHNAM